MQTQPPKYVKRTAKLREWNMSRTTGWRRERDDPTFPRPILLGRNLWVYEALACDSWERAQIETTALRTRRAA